MATTPEGRVKQSVRKLLVARGIWYYMPVAGPFAVHGVPDFVCVWKGRFLGVETKAPGKRKNTTPNQDRILEAITAHGGLAVVVDDVAQLETFLEEHS